MTLKENGAEVLNQEFFQATKKTAKIFVEKNNETREFVIDVYGVDHFKYRFDPKTKKFQICFFPFHRTKTKRGER